MRVIGRFLLGTLAIVFAMGFIARLVRRRPHRHARRLSRLPHGQSPSAVHPESIQTYLAALPGGSGWGHLLVPPSSPSRTLRRKGRRKKARAPLGAGVRKR